MSQIISSNQITISNIYDGTTGGRNYLRNSQSLVFSSYIFRGVGILTETKDVLTTENGVILTIE